MVQQEASTRETLAAVFADVRSLNGVVRSHVHNYFETVPVTVVALRTLVRLADVVGCLQMLDELDAGLVNHVAFWTLFFSTAIRNRNVVCSSIFNNLRVQPQFSIQLFNASNKHTSCVSSYAPPASEPP